MSGLLLGRNVVESFMLDAVDDGMAHVPVVLLGFVGALLQFALMARRAAGDSRSIRRQWWWVRAPLARACCLVRLPLRQRHEHRLGRVDAVSC